MQPLVIAPVIAAVVLLVSGVAKLRTTEATRRAFAELQVPKALNVPIVIMGLPWFELLGGVGVLVLPGWAGILCAVGVLALFGCYLAIVARARRRQLNATCSCFGTLTSGSITRVTLWRNVILVLVAIAALVDISTQQSSVLGRVLQYPSDVGWLVAAALAALVTGLIVFDPDVPVVPGEQRAAEQVEDLDYLRTPIPFATLVDRGGEVVTLRDLAAARPVLLFFLSSACPHCHDVAVKLDQWQQQLSIVDVRVIGAAAQLVATWPDLAEQVLDDPDDAVARLFQVGRPAAVLLGADGLLAGGPVTGSTMIETFVDEIIEQLVAVDAPVGTGGSDGGEV